MSRETRSFWSRIGYRCDYPPVLNRAWRDSALSANRSTSHFDHELNDRQLSVDSSFYVVYFVVSICVSLLDQSTHDWWSSSLILEKRGAAMRESPIQILRACRLGWLLILSLVPVVFAFLPELQRSALTLPRVSQSPRRHPAFLNQRCEAIISLPPFTRIASAVQDGDVGPSEDLETPVQALFNKYCDSEGLMNKAAVLNVPPIAELLVSSFEIRVHTLSHRVSEEENFALELLRDNAGNTTIDSETRLSGSRLICECQIVAHFISFIPDRGRRARGV